MGRKMAFSPMYFFFILLLLIHVVRISEGLSIELIHPFSPESPFYEPNITFSEMMERFFSHPLTRHKTNYNSTFPGMKVIRPVLEHGKLGYHAKLNLGTFQGVQPSYKTYYLHFDTGSEIIWLECEDCAKPQGHCFGEPGLAYPNSKSITYTPLLYDHHPLCFPNDHIGQYCSYELHYGDQSHTSGILAYETFTFDSFRTLPAETARIVIGCGTNNQLTVVTRANEAGVMGMGWSPHSFISQINTHSQGRFSYCLSPLASSEVRGRSAILHFGPDTPTVHGLRSLTIHRYWRLSAYYVKLLGISINNRRLNIPPEYFTKTSPDKGGCIFDTGTSHTIIPMRAYRILKEEMIQYLSVADGSLKIRRGVGVLDLCFERHPPLKGYAHLPTITFHFEEGADFVMQRDVVFLALPKTDRETFCMTIRPAGEDNVAVIGAHGQANHVIVYDLPAKKMYFGPRDCARNP